MIGEIELHRADFGFVQDLGTDRLEGDRLTDLDPVRLEILRKILPAYGQAARRAGIKAAAQETPISTITAAAEASKAVSCI